MKIFGIELPFLDEVVDRIQALNMRLDVKKKNGNTIITLSNDDGKATIVTGPEGLLDVRSIGYDKDVPMNSEDVTGIGTTETTSIDNIRKTLTFPQDRMKITVAHAGYLNFYVGGGATAAVALSPEFEEYLLDQMRLILIEQGRIPSSTAVADKEMIVFNFGCIMDASDFVNRFLMSPMKGSDINMYTGKLSLGPDENDCDGSVLEQDTLYVMHLKEQQKKEEYPLMWSAVLSNSLNTWKENIDINESIDGSIMSDHYEAVSHLLIQMMDNDFYLPNNKLRIEHVAFRPCNGGMGETTAGWEKLQVQKDKVLNGKIDITGTFLPKGATSTVSGFVASMLAIYYFGEQVSIIENESGVSLHYPDHQWENKRILKHLKKLRPYLIKELADEFEEE